MSENGDASTYRHGSLVSEKSEEDNGEQKPIIEKVNEYIKELLGEKLALEGKYPLADRLLDQEISKIQQSGRIPPKEVRYVDIYREKPIRVVVKVLVPVKEHPKFNFVGKLLGPKGNSMKRLQEETMCKMVILGRGSMKDRKKEEELRTSLDPKYAHLNDELHVEISTIAPPAEAHARTAYALAGVRKYLIPDSNDDIRQEQLRELIANGSLPADTAQHENGVRYQYKGKMTRSPTTASRNIMTPKQKVMSILDKARYAMEESYGYKDQQYEVPPPPQPQQYESYSYSHSQMVPTTSRPIRYEAPEYEPKPYVRDYYHGREATSYPGRIHR